jgi:peptidyl-prolyl cis-trans isomerase A (cyclophilin A)
MPDSLGKLGAAGLLTALAAVIMCCGSCARAPVAGGHDDDPRVVLGTELGDITIEVYSERAPVTTENFLRYVAERRFRGASFYRTVRLDNQPDNAVKIGVIQGGLKDDLDSLALPPIAHETTAVTGILHKDGTVSMARREPGTASSEIFICIGDQPELDFGGKRNPDGQGFAAFGKVVAGMDVVRRIQAQPADGQLLKPEILIREVGLVIPQQ